jgi:hypothetical protein
VKEELEFYHFSLRLFKTEEFRCGQEDLDKYVQSTMQQNERNNLSMHYLGVTPGKKFVSLFCLLASSVECVQLKNPPKYLPRNTLPTIKVGRLAVRSDCQRQGFGTQTLTKAVSLYVKLSSTLGTIGLTIDA